MIPNDEHYAPRNDELQAHKLEYKLEDELSPDEAPPPAVPKRTKDYHKDSKSTIKEIKESSSDKKVNGNKTEQVSPSQTSEKTKLEREKEKVL